MHANMRMSCRWTAILAGGLGLGAGPAGVKLDGTLGGAAQALSGPSYNITQNLGRLSGSNLFFSFQYFNIATGETALFSTTSGGIHNVVSRVTGGYASNIDGTLRLEAASGAPNFYLINPSGVTFTTHAVVDVPAVLYVTTANYVKFTDGSAFYADPSRVSTLSTAPPEAFGFLGNTRAAVDLTGALLLGGAGGAGPIQVIAGDVALDGGGNVSGILTSSGDIRVVATGAQPIEVPLSGPVDSSAGTVAITNGAGLATHGGPDAAAGNIYISAGSLLLDGAGVPAGATITGGAGALGGGGIAIDVAGNASLVNGGFVSTAPRYAGGGGGISLNAGSLVIQGGNVALTGIQSFTVGVADSGPIDVNVTGATTISAGAELVSATNGAGKAGDLSLRTGSLTLDGGPSNLSTPIGSFTAGAGDAGNVSIASAGAVAIASAGQIGSSTSAGGNAGAVALTTGSLTIDGGTSTAFTGLQSAAKPGSSGNAGTLSVRASGAVSLVSGGQIQSDTSGAGSAGAVALTAASLNVDGEFVPVPTGISSSADQGSTGNAASVSIGTSGATTLTDGGVIESVTYGSGNAGNVALTAGSLSINADGSTLGTGISTTSAGAGSGSAGNITINSSNTLQLLAGGEISSDTFSSRNAGDVTISAGSLSIAGGTSRDNTWISSNTDGGAGADAGRVSVTTGSLTIDGGTSSGFTGIFSDSGLYAAMLGLSSPAGSAGTVTVTVAHTATLVNGGAISSDTYAAGNAGDVSLTAGSLIVPAGNSPAGVSTDTNGAPTANGGRVSVTTGTLELEGGGISSDAGGLIGNGGAAGTVDVTVSGAASLSNGAYITSNTYTASNAGDVNVSAGSLSLSAGSSPFFTAIASETNGASSANAGHVAVTAGTLSINGGGKANAAISTDSGAVGSHTGGSAGTISVNVTGAVTLSGGGSIESDTFTAGHAGDVTVSAGSLSADSSAGSKPSQISSTAEPISSGNAGQVQVATAGGLRLTDGSVIQTNAYASGNAGNVTVSAGSLSIDGGTSPNPTGIFSDSAAPPAVIGGAAGTVAVNVSGTLTLSNAGYIASDTYTSGNAGDVTVSAYAVGIDGSGGAVPARISSVTEASGNAGRVSVTTSTATLTNGALITSSTSGSGDAGAVTLTTHDLNIDGGSSSKQTGISSDALMGASGSAGVVGVNVSGTAQLTQGSISSSADVGSRGQPGTVTISAGTILLDGNGVISIQNGATSADPNALEPTQIDIHARNLSMNGGQITAASTGNIAASSIDITYAHSLHMDPSSITTAAVQGNGGSISILGQGPLWIQDSSITTSVLGTTNGNGGNIRIVAPFIILDSGAIQANTQAPKAAGGDVTIDAQALIPSFASYVLGGAERAFDPTVAGLNVVQAAAPEGVSGTLSVTVPTLDLGNSLTGLTGKPVTPTALGRSPCIYRHGSSLSLAGRGGLPVSARDPLWVDAEATPASSTGQSESGRKSAPIDAIACR